MSQRTDRNKIGCNNDQLAEKPLTSTWICNYTQDRSRHALKKLKSFFKSFKWQKRNEKGEGRKQARKKEEGREGGREIK